MSIRLMCEAWLIDLPAPRKLVLLKLADHASDDGVCWPAAEYIAAQCNISRRQVQIHICALAQAGLVSREARHDVRGGQISNMYRLHLQSSAAKVAPPHVAAVRPGSDADTDTPAHPPPSPALDADQDEIVEYVRLAGLFGRPEERPRSPSGLRRYLRRHGLTVEHREQLRAWEAREITAAQPARPPDVPPPASPPPPAPDTVSEPNTADMVATHTPHEVCAARIRAIIATGGRDYRPEAAARAGP